MVGAGRVLTACGRWPMRAYAAALDIASLFTGIGALMEPTYDRNSINTIFGRIQ
jgi:hypothetical protein